MKKSSFKFATPITIMTSGKIIVSALIGTFASLCLSTANAQTLTSNAEGTNNGFFYSFWKDNGDASMTLLAGGRYQSNWTNSNNWVGGKGWNPGNSSRTVSYSGNYGVNDSQNSYLALYGWTRSPLIEYYVVESFGSYNPSTCSGGTDYGSFQSDGATYNVRRCQRVNQPSIDGTQTFYQYFSVRNPKKGFGNISGTITFANHVNFWASKGLNLGSNHYYQIMATEGYQSRGSSDITVSGGGGGGGGSSSSASSTGGGGGVTPPSGQIIIRARHSNACLDVPSNSTGNGTLIQQWGCHSGSNQKWTFNSKGGGWYEVKSASSGRCLDVAGVSQDNGANMQLWDCSGGNNQQFKLTSVGSGFYLLTARHSNKCVNVYGNSTANGARIIQWDCNTSAQNEHFKFN
jgi:Glycosyl hydrolases family 11/Ricin-type beta-trefoil lectin domain-like